MTHLAAKCLHIAKAPGAQFESNISENLIKLYWYFLHPWKPSKNKIFYLADEKIKDFNQRTIEQVP
jgi:hypothetical protein